MFSAEQIGPCVERARAERRELAIDLKIFQTRLADLRGHERNPGGIRPERLECLAGP